VILGFTTESWDVLKLENLGVYKNMKLPFTSNQALP
jgi:hypothetical protein